MKRFDGRYVRHEFIMPLVRYGMIIGNSTVSEVEEAQAQPLNSKYATIGGKLRYVDGNRIFTTEKSQSVIAELGRLGFREANPKELRQMSLLV